MIWRWERHATAMSATPARLKMNESKEVLLISGAGSLAGGLGTNEHDASLDQTVTPLFVG